MLIMPSIDHIITKYHTHLEKYPMGQSDRLLFTGDQMDQAYKKLGLTAYKSSIGSMHKQQQITMVRDQLGPQNFPHFFH